MSEQQIAGLKIQQTGGLVHVKLDRAEKRNAIDVDTCNALRQFLFDADRDRTIRAIVISGVEKDFCTGADISGSASSIATMTTLDYRFSTTDYQNLFQQMWEAETPIVSAVTGTVAGAGWMLALLADLVVAAQGARWTHVFARRGMIPHAGDPYFMPRIIPLHRLNEIALLSDPIESETLHQWGLVNRCVPADQVVATALELGQRLADGPTRSLSMAKRLYRRSLDQDISTVFEAERMAQALISTTKDRGEGVKSMMERRPSEFIGD